MRPLFSVMVEIEEIPVQILYGELPLLTIRSDCQLAREVLLRAAKETIGGYLLEVQKSWKEITENYRNANPPLEPNFTVVLNAGSFEFSVSYVVDYMKRTSVKDQLFTKIVEEVVRSNGRLEWASTAVRVVA
jgi:hypothetical protein